MDVDVDVREIGIDLSLVVLSAIVVFSGLEVALQLGLVENHSWVPQVKVCDGSEEDRFHPEYGWTARPGAQQRVKYSRDDWDRYTVNENGFRDNFDSGDRSIVVLGDSFTYGVQADDNSTYTYLLDRWSDDVSFHNFGGRDYGTAQELLVYRDVADEIDHDAVVLQYFTNDPENNVDASIDRPRFELRGDDLVLAHEPESRSGLFIRENPYTRRLHFAFSDTFATYRYLYPRVKALVGGDLDPTPPKPPTGAERRRQFRLTRALIEAIASEAREENATVLVVFTPSRGDVNPENPRTYRPADGRPYWNAQRKLLRNVAASEGNVELLDLTPTLRDEHQRGNDVYGQVDPHFNEYGQFIAARKIHERLASMGYLPTGSRAFPRYPEANRCTE